MSSPGASSAESSLQKGDFKAAEEHYRKRAYPAAERFGGKDRTGDRIHFHEPAGRSHFASGERGEGRSDQHRGALSPERAISARGPHTDAERELDTFRHYQDLKDKLGKVFKQLAAPSIPR